MAVVAALCRKRGAEFTSIRRHLLDLLCQAGRPLGAYELLPRLEMVLERKVKPATVYRGLEFLTGLGVVARIESRNAFVSCAHPEQSNACVFFLCDHCNGSTEVENNALERLVAVDASTLGFHVSRRVFELRGTCARCQSHSP